MVTLLIQCLQSDAFKIRTEKAYSCLLAAVGSCSVGVFYYITTIRRDNDLENNLVILCGCEYIVKTGAQLNCLSRNFVQEYR